MIYQKPKKQDKEGKFSANGVFGVSDKRADEIINAFKHARIDCNGWLEVLEAVEKSTKLKEGGEAAYFGYIFGRMYERDQAPSSLIDAILRH